jgi:hypothetical protein
MSTPRVTEIVSPLHHVSSAMSRVERDDFADMAEPARPTRMAPYHRPSAQRELVRQSLALVGAFDDFHGDGHRRV